MPRRNHILSLTGYTLVELLITIAIIAILAGLSLSAFRSAMERQRSVGCLAQLRQISSVLQLYALDNDNRLPRSYFTAPRWQSWSGDSPLADYAGGAKEWDKLVVCRENRMPVATSVNSPTGYPYTVNYNILRPTVSTNVTEFPQVNPGLLPMASKIILMLDAKTLGQWGIGFNSKVSGWTRASDHHQKHANVLWADGHVTATSLHEITDANIIPSLP